MKRALFVILAIALCISAFVGCAKEGKDGAEFEFSIELEKTSYRRGEVINVTASVTNVSGKTIRYIGCSGNDFIPSIELYSSASGGEEKSYLSCDPIAFPSDVVNKKVKNGEGGSIVYSFPIPEDAKLGSYSVTLCKGEDSREFADVLSITEPTAQNENEKYQYTSVSVSSAGMAIHPIKFLLFTTEYDQSGEPLLFGDGFGSYGFFSDNEAKPSDLPTLLASSEVTVAASEHLKLGSISVYDTAYNELDYSLTWEELHTLPQGEYVVVFSESTDSRDTDHGYETYWQTTYENIFRLIIS